MNDGDYLEEELHGAVEEAYIDLTYGKKQSENPRWSQSQILCKRKIVQ